MAERPLSIEELYTHIEEGLAECENQIRHHVLQAILNYGVESERNEETGEIERYWIQASALDLVRAIQRAIEQTLKEGTTNAGEPASEQQLDYVRRLYVRFVLLGRYCKNNPQDDE